MKNRTTMILTMLAMLMLFIVFMTKGRPASAFPSMEADCTKCHGVAGDYPNPVFAIPEATLVAPGDSYQVAITVSVPVSGATGTGYWIANSDAVSATGSSTGIFAGAAGQGVDGKWSATMIAPGISGAYFYKVFGQSGKTGEAGFVGYATYRIEVSNDAPRLNKTLKPSTPSPAVVNCSGACHEPRPWTNSPMPPPGWKPNGPGTGDPTSGKPGSPPVVNCSGSCHEPRPWTNSPMPPPGWKPNGPGTGTPGLPLPTPTGTVTTPVPSVPPTGTVKPTVPPVTPSPTPVITTPVPPINNGPGQQLFTTYCSSCHATAASYGGLVTGATAISITTALLQVPAMAYLQTTLQPQDVINLSSYLNPTVTAKLMAAVIPVTTTPTPSISPSPVDPTPSASPGSGKVNPPSMPTPAPLASPNATPTPTPTRANGDRPEPTSGGEEKDQPKPLAAPEREKEEPGAAPDSAEDARNTKPSRAKEGRGEQNESKQMPSPSRADEDRFKLSSLEIERVSPESKMVYRGNAYQGGD